MFKAIPLVLLIPLLYGCRSNDQPQVQQPQEQPQQSAPYKQFDTSITFSDQWQPVGTDDNQLYLSFDPATVQKSGHLRQAWLLWEQLSPQDNTQIEFITTELGQFDCKSLDAISVKLTSVHVPTQQQENKIEPQKGKIQPGTLLEQAKNALCQF